MVGPDPYLRHILNRLGTGLPQARVSDARLLRLRIQALRLATSNDFPKPSSGDRYVCRRRYRRSSRRADGVRGRGRRRHRAHHRRTRGGPGRVIPRPAPTPTNAERTLPTGGSLGVPSRPARKAGAQRIRSEPGCAEVKGQPVKTLTIVDHWRFQNC